MEESNIFKKLLALALLGFMRLFKFLFPRKSENENVIQYILRQFYLSDSKGTPSLTVTILGFVMLIVGVVTIIEAKMALMPIQVLDATGKIVKTMPNGFSVSFLSLVISLSVVITAFYRQRQRGIQETPDQVLDSGLVNKAKDYIKSVLGNGTSGTPPTIPPIIPGGQAK